MVTPNKFKTVKFAGVLQGFLAVFLFLVLIWTGTFLHDMASSAEDFKGLPVSLSSPVPAPSLVPHCHEALSDDHFDHLAAILSAQQFFVPFLIFVFAAVLHFQGIQQRRFRAVYARTLARNTGAPPTYILKRSLLI